MLLKERPLPSSVTILSTIRLGEDAIAADAAAAVAAAAAKAALFSIVL